MPTKIDSSKCQNHLVCVEVCPEGVYEEKDGKPVIANPENCTEIYLGIA